MGSKDLKFTITVLVPFFATIIDDLRRFKDAKSKDPAVKFDWNTALVGWAIGALAGVSAALVGVQTGAI